MARTSPEILLAKIIRGYLDTVASRAAGVPAAADCALVLMDDGKAERVPALVVSGIEEKGSKTACKRMVHISVFLAYMLRVAGDEAPADEESLAQTLTREQAGVIMDAVESRLRDRAAFASYLNGLTTELRSGWKILKYHPMPAEEMRRDKEDPKMMHALNIQITLAWSESAI